MEKLDLKRTDLDSLLIAALRPGMRANSKLALIRSGVYATLLPDLRDQMNPSFEQRFTRQVIQYGMEEFDRRLFLSISIGAAVQILGDSSRAWLWRAGDALVKAKKSGGNRQITNVDLKNSWLVNRTLNLHPWLIPPWLD